MPFLSKFLAIFVKFTPKTARNGPNTRIFSKYTNLSCWKWFFFSGTFWNKFLIKYKLKKEVPLMFFIRISLTSQCPHYYSTILSLPPTKDIAKWELVSFSLFRLLTFLLRQFWFLLVLATFLQLVTTAVWKWILKKACCYVNAEIWFCPK